MIVDDEPLAQRVIENYAGNLSYLNVGWKCDSALEALEALHGGAEPDVILLDIEMPRLSGLGLVRALNHPQLIVFTTAYGDHAVEGFELEAIDYLKKPFSFERFTRSLDRVQQQLEMRAAAVEKGKADGALAEDDAVTNRDTAGDSRSPFFVKSDRGLQRVRYEEIVMIEGIGDYVKFHLTSGNLVSKRSLREWEDTLPAAEFLRVHRSYLVPWEKIESVEGSEIRMRNLKVPIGRAYRAQLMEKLRVR